MLFLTKELEAGLTVTLRPRGGSMEPRIKSGALVTIAPCTEPAVGDVVLAKVHGHFLLHLVTAKGADGRYQISNNHGHVNGWASKVYGKVIKVEP